MTKITFKYYMKSINYINGKELYCEVIYCQALGYRTRKLDDMLIKIANGVNKRFSYYNDDDRQDCLMEAIASVLYAWHSFNSDKTENAFAYLTEIIKRGHTKGLNDIYQQKGVKAGEAKIKIYSIQGMNDGQGMHSLI